MAATRSHDDHPQRVRQDALPEAMSYPDDGCAVNPTCLHCPLAKCVYDLPSGMTSIIRLRQQMQALAMRGKGATIEQVANALGLSKRTVFRYLRR